MRDVAVVVWGCVLGKEETAEVLSVKKLSKSVKVEGLREGVRVAVSPVAEGS